MTSSGMHQFEFSSIERDIGIRRGKTRQKVHCVIRETPEDFQVDESLDGIHKIRAIWPIKTRSGLFTQFLLFKSGIDTLSAIEQLATLFKRPIEDFSYAGLKDARATTSQRVSAWNMLPSQLENLSSSRFYISQPIRTRYSLKLGDCYGNFFHIVLKEVPDSKQENVSKLMRDLKEIRRSFFPNYFGPQRFGTTRPILHLMGKEILKRNFKRAIELYLFSSSPLERKYVSETRKELEEERNYRKILEKLPYDMSIEHTLINHLIHRKDDYWGALQKLPHLTQRLIISSFQSFVFNLLLSKILENITPDEIQIDTLLLPIIGSETKLEKYPFMVQEAIEEILLTERIFPHDFSFTDHRKWTAKGSERPAFSRVEKLVIRWGSEKPILELDFLLKSGCYATVFLQDNFNCVEPITHSG